MREIKIKIDRQKDRELVLWVVCHKKYFSEYCMIQQVSTERNFKLYFLEMSCTGQTNNSIGLEIDSSKCYYIAHHNKTIIGNSPNHFCKKYHFKTNQTDIVSIFLYFSCGYFSRSRKIIYEDLYPYLSRLAPYLHLWLKNLIV